MPKDDKSYPFIKITNERYPSSLIITRQVKNKTEDSTFGPYPDVGQPRNQTAIDRLFLFRKYQLLAL